uniref:S1-like domain-containing protein n=1 Tax=Ganoderma boninense TaxID=34458 RepID=A0A5K1K3G1_9APHY|nr:S1-like domain-containing protein [Ganoderma boninense]
MTTHLAGWRDFANDRLGIELEAKDIILVSGFLKTTVWGTAAFSNISDSAELVVAGGCFVPSASGAFRVSMSRGVEASVISRAGPQDRISTWNDSPSQDFKYDQCIFLSYYKMKYRRMIPLPRIMRAAAGPHTLPHDDDDHNGALASTLSSTNSKASDSQEEFIQTVGTDARVKVIML